MVAWNGAKHSCLYGPSARSYGLSRSRIVRSKHPNSRPSVMPISAIPVSRAFERRALRNPRIELDSLSPLYVTASSFKNGCYFKIITKNIKILQIVLKVMFLKVQ